MVLHGRLLITFVFIFLDPLTPVLEYQIKGVEKNSFANVTIVWSSSGNEQYQYLVSISSLKSDRVNFTTSVAMINVTLEIGVGYSITVTAERCNGSVRSMTSESLDIVLPGMLVHCSICARPGYTCALHYSTRCC